MRYLFLVALVGCSSPKPETVFPAQCGVCDKGQSDDAAVLVDDGMLAARRAEYGPMFDTHITWTGSEPHLRIGLGFEGGAGLVRSHRVRLLGDGVASFGAIGDTQHGMLFFGGDLRLKVSFMNEMTLYDLYGVWSVGALAGVINVAPSESVAPIGVAGTGIGFRLFRSVAVELTGNVVHAFDTPFVNSSGKGSQWIPDFNIGARFDFCSLGKGCDVDPIKQSRTDLTCAAYAEATRVCDAAQSANARAELCTQALAAMATSDRVEPTVARDAVDTFLDKLEKTDPNLHDALDRLVTKNKCLTGWRTCGRAYECSLAQKGQKPDDHRIYAPYVLEVMAALGCDASGQPAKRPDGTQAACGYACEDAIKAKDKAVCAVR